MSVSVLLLFVEFTVDLLDIPSNLGLAARFRYAFMFSIKRKLHSLEALHKWCLMFDPSIPVWTKYDTVWHSLSLGRQQCDNTLLPRSKNDNFSWHQSWTCVNRKLKLTSFRIFNQMNWTSVSFPTNLLSVDITTSVFQRKSCSCVYNYQEEELHEWCLRQQG